MLRTNKLQKLVSIFSLFAIGLISANASAQESKLELLIKFAQDSRPLTKYSEHRDAVMNFTCSNLGWTLAWTQRNDHLKGKVRLKSGLKEYDVSKIETALFNNFSMINTPKVLCSDFDENSGAQPMQIFVTGTDKASSNSKALIVYFDEFSEETVTFQEINYQNHINQLKQKKSTFDDLVYTEILACNDYTWKLQWTRNSLASEGVVRVNYRDQNVVYDPMGQSIFDDFLLMSTPSLFCTAPRNLTKNKKEGPASQLRLGGLSKSKGIQARAIITARAEHGLLVINAESLSK